MKLLTRAGALSVSTAGGLGKGLESRWSARSYGPELPGLGPLGAGLRSALQLNLQANWAPGWVGQALEGPLVLCAEET